MSPKQRHSCATRICSLRMILERFWLKMRWNEPGEWTNAKLSKMQAKKLPRVDKSGSSMVARIVHGTREMAGQCARSSGHQPLAITIIPHRHLAIVGQTGHVAAFDWRTGTIHAELQLQETCRDITYVDLMLLLAVFKCPSQVSAGSIILCSGAEKICIYI